MWRIGVLVLATGLVQIASEDAKNGDNSLLLQRLKRSPQYDNCGSYYPPPPPPPPPYWGRHPRFWPPPPPPPPPPFWPPPPPPPPPPPSPVQVIDVYTADAQANSQANSQVSPQPVNPAPCTTCGDNGQSNAISNAKSDSGQAIAVAIARANTH